MKKKTLALLLAISCALSTVACGVDEGALAEKRADFDEYNIQVEGVEYSLPCPVSEFLDNGFTIDAADSDELIQVGDGDTVVLCYNDRTLDVEVKNYEGHAATIEDCSVIALEANLFRAGVDIVFPGDIQLSDSEKELKEALKGLNYNKVTDGDTYYWMTESDSSSRETYTFIVSNGKIIFMDTKNWADPE